MLTSENRLFNLSITLGIVGASCSNNMIKNQTFYTSGMCFSPYLLYLFIYFGMFLPNEVKYGL